MHEPEEVRAARLMAEDPRYSKHMAEKRARKNKAYQDQYGHEDQLLQNIPSGYRMGNGCGTGCGFEAARIDHKTKRAGWWCPNCEEHMHFL